MKCNICQNLQQSKCCKNLGSNAYFTNWTCQECTLSRMPLTCKDISYVCTDINDNNTNAELKKHIRHLNTKSMVSMYYVFQFMVHETKFDIITLSETWLKNEKHLLEYVNLTSYKFSDRN